MFSARPLDFEFIGSRILSFVDMIVEQELGNNFNSLEH